MNIGIFKQEMVKRSVSKWLVSGLCIAVWIVSTPVAAYAGPRKVNVQLTDHGFSPSNVLAALNQPIQIHIINTGHHTHQFSIPYYSIYSSNLAPGAVTDVGFSPWTSGRFQMLSNPSGTNNPEFTGQFVVVDGK